MLASYQCIRCQKVAYCSEACQRKNWAWHRPQCNSDSRGAKAPTRTPLTSRLPSGASVSRFFPGLTQPEAGSALTARYARRPEARPAWANSKTAGPRGAQPNRSDPFGQSTMGSEVGRADYRDPYRAPKTPELRCELDQSLGDWKNSNDASTVQARQRVKAARTALKVQKARANLQPRPPFSPCNPSEARSTITSQRRGHENHSHMHVDPWRFENFWTRTPSDGPYNSSANNAYVTAASPHWLKRQHQTDERIEKRHRRTFIDPSPRADYTPSGTAIVAQRKTRVNYFLNSPSSEQQEIDRLETQDRVCAAQIEREGIERFCAQAVFNKEIFLQTMRSNAGSSRAQWPG